MKIRIKTAAGTVCVEADHMHCGGQSVWKEDSPGDYYVGEGYLCVECHHAWTIQGPAKVSDNAGNQRLVAIVYEILKMPAS